MADAADSKSVGRKPVKVRLLSPAPPPRNTISNSAASFRHSERALLRFVLRIRTSAAFERNGALSDYSNESSSKYTLTPRYFHAILSNACPPGVSPQSFTLRTITP